MKGFIKYLSSLFIILFSGAMIACGGGGGGSTPLTEQQLTEQDAAKIEIMYTDGNNINAVTDNISLPDSGDNGSDITWTSNNSGYLDADGAVNRPAFGTGNQTVTLTATLINGDCTITRDFIFTILEMPPTDSEAVAQAKSALEIGFSGTDNTNNLTQDITLINESFNDTEISWSSDNTAYITNDGDVTQPSFSSGDQTVTLTATISRNGVSDTKSFILTVKTAPPTDVEAVAQVKSSLSINYENTDTASSVTLDVGLITSGSYDTTISWETTNSLYISASGNVTRPEYLTGDQTVTLTATITKNSTQDTKEFILTVTKLAITPAERISQDNASLEITYQNTDNASNVTQSVTLPTSGSNGTSISWVTSNEAYITTAGNVMRPIQPAANQPVTLTATISYEGVSDTKQFTLTVISRPLTDAEAVAQDKAALEIGYASGNNSTNVTQNVTLAGSGSNATTITWITSDGAYITTAGNVTRPPVTESNKNVTLTATIEKNGVSDTKTFTLTVIKNFASDLSGFTISDTTSFSPVFAAATTTYKAYTGKDQTTVGVTATPLDPTATFTIEYINSIGGSAVNSWTGQSGITQSVSIVSGYNLIRIRVSNANASPTEKIYIFYVWRTYLVDNGDGTITNTRTTANMMWVKAPTSSVMTYSYLSGTYVANYNSGSPAGGYTNWRIPTETELRGLVYCWNYIQETPRSYLEKQGFTNFNSSGPAPYWTSTTGDYANTRKILCINESNINSAWDSFYETNSYNILLVRDL